MKGSFGTTLAPEGGGLHSSLTAMYFLESARQESEQVLIFRVFYLDQGTRLKSSGVFELFRMAIITGN